MGKKLKSLSHVRLFATPWTIAYQALLYMEFSRQEHWSGYSHSLLQGIFQTQVSYIAGRFFTITATTEVLYVINVIKTLCTVCGTGRPTRVNEKIQEYGKPVHAAAKFGGRKVILHVCFFFNIHDVLPPMMQIVL